jgi:glycosyltransferase involved in cell wall biosynthesis
MEPVRSVTPSAIVLYASYVSPFPPHSGERIRALNLISGLRALGCRVEAIVGNHDGVELETHNREGVRFHQIPFAWPRLRQAATAYFRPQTEFIRQVRALHRANALSAILLDYGFMGAQIVPLSRLGIPVLLGTHNVESAVTRQVPKASLAGRLAIRLRQAVEFAHERRFFREADAVLCVSEEDRREYARFLPADRLHVVPNFVDVPDIYADTLRENRIIMTGSFGNFQNVEGLRWFVNEVWDESLRSRVTLSIAGQSSDRAIGEFAHVPGIVGLGAREDLLAEIGRARCAIVPLWGGGGTRLKCIEAMATRTPVVSTSKGCEGIEHGGAFRVADTPAEFRAAIHAVLNNPADAVSRTGRARSIFDRDYSVHANAVRLDRAMASARRVRSSRAGNRD